jgi:hypothetical protein
MMTLLRNLFGHRSRGFGPFRRRSRGLELNRRNGGITLGTIAMLAAPFIVRKLKARRAQGAYGAAY